MEQMQREDARIANEDFQDRQQQPQSQEPPSIPCRGRKHIQIPKSVNQKGEEVPMQEALSAGAHTGGTSFEM